MKNLTKVTSLQKCCTKILCGNFKENWIEFLYKFYVDFKMDFNYDHRKRSNPILVVPVTLESWSLLFLRFLIDWINKVKWNKKLKTRMFKLCWSLPPRTTYWKTFNFLSKCLILGIWSDLRYFTRNDEYTAVELNLNLLKLLAVKHRIFNQINRPTTVRCSTKVHN